MNGSETTAPQLPAWGIMDKELLTEIELFPIAKHWQMNEPEPVRRVEWPRWREALVSEIGNLIWPPLAPGARGWEEDTVAALNHADFLCLSQLNRYIDEPILPGTSVVHGELFSEEDDGSGLGIGYERYDPTLPRQHRNELRRWMLEGIGNKVGTLGLQLKAIFQRPRPYQVALLQNRADFSHLYSSSASTPSLVSGHCLQGALAVCNVYVQLREQLNALSEELLAQYLVDIGDRRVFAGIHYPSDNLSSWLTALWLIPGVFGAPLAAAVQQFLRMAITKKSIVYRAILQHAGAPNSVYAPILQRL